MAQGLSAFFSLVLMIVSITVGVRLLLLARETRGLPEFVFGIGLIVVIGMGFPLTIAGRALVADSPGTARLLMMLGAIPLGLGWSAIWVFTWQVFRADSPIGRGVFILGIVATASAALASIVTTATAADVAAINFASAPFLAGPCIVALGYGWAMVESFSYYGRMQKRLALGLADPVVANRFLLWGLVVLSSMLGNVMRVGGNLLGHNAVSSPAIMITTALIGIGCSISMWLAFLPPVSYGNWIRARAKSAA